MKKIQIQIIRFWGENRVIYSQLGIVAHMRRFIEMKFLSSSY